MAIGSFKYTWSYFNVVHWLIVRFHHLIKDFNKLAKYFMAFPN